MQAQLLNTISLPELTDLIRKQFIKTQMMVKPAAMPLFIKDPIAKGNGNTKRFDEIDTQTFARNKKQGEAAKKASVAIGYNIIVTKKRIALEIDITQEMLDENRYPEVGALITNLSWFCPQRIELDMTHRFTFCNSTSYTDMDGDIIDLTTGDGLSVANSAHTLKYSALTYSNRVSGDPLFSRGALEAAELLTVSNILSNFGERRVINFNTIVSSDDPNTCNTIKQFLRSTTDVDQNNPGVINPYFGKYQHCVLPYLATTAVQAYDSTKKHWWFLVACGLGANGWQSYYAEWEAAHLQSPDNEQSNLVDGHRDIWSYGTRAGYGLGVVSGRGFIASCPSN